MSRPSAPYNASLSVPAAVAGACVGQRRRGEVVVGANGHRPSAVCRRYRLRWTSGRSSARSRHRRARVRRRARWASATSCRGWLAAPPASAGPAVANSIIATPGTGRAARHQAHPEEHARHRDWERRSPSLRHVQIKGHAVGKLNRACQRGDERHALGEPDAELGAGVERVRGCGLGLAQDAELADQGAIKGGARTEADDLRQARIVGPRGLGAADRCAGPRCPTRPARTVINTATRIAQAGTRTLEMRRGPASAARAFHPRPATGQPRAGPPGAARPRQSRR